MAASLAFPTEPETEAPAQGTPTVTQFRDLRTVTTGTRWTDVRTTLAANPSVRISGEPELAIFHVKK